MASVRNFILAKYKREQLAKGVSPSKVAYDIKVLRPLPVPVIKRWLRGKKKKKGK